MIKKIFNRLKQKPSKSDHEGAGASVSSSSGAKGSSDIVGNRSRGRRVTFRSPLISSSNTAVILADKLLPAVNAKLNGNVAPAAYEALPAFRDVSSSNSGVILAGKLSPAVNAKMNVNVVPAMYEALPAFRDVSSSNSGVTLAGKLWPAVNAKMNGNVAPATYEALPAFGVVPNSEKQNLFVRKLQLCSVVFDFTDPTKNIKGKNIKRQTLLELVDYITSANEKFAEIIVQEMVKMLSINLFRTISNPPRENKTFKVFDLEEEPFMDPAWPHLQVVYELFLSFVASPETDAKLAKGYIDQSFVIKVLDLFDSEDPREREFLKTVLHRIYGKFMVHRPFIRKAINNIFYRFIYETEKHNGIAELLEILGSIVNGFTLPLKEEHKSFLVRVLIPLHKPKCISMYHPQLSYCITQFVEKDRKLADTVIRGLLKYWPITNSSKEVMFLGELEEVLEKTQPPEFQRCMIPLFCQIGRCLSSSHYQKGLYFYGGNYHIENLIKKNWKVILPIIFPSLERNTRSHWNQAVQSLALNVRKIFSDTDSKLFEQCLQKYHDDEANANELNSRRDAICKRLEDIPATNSVDLN